MYFLGGIGRSGGERGIRFCPLAGAEQKQADSAIHRARGGFGGDSPHPESYMVFRYYSGSECSKVSQKCHKPEDKREPAWSGHSQRCSKAECHGAEMTPIAQVATCRERIISQSEMRIFTDLDQAGQYSVSAGRILSIPRQSFSFASVSASGRGVFFPSRNQR